MAHSPIAYYYYFLFYSLVPLLLIIRAGNHLVFAKSVALLNLKIKNTTILPRYFAEIGVDS
jgi:hypothetical protein